MSPARKPTKPVDIYVRVSQVAGREGDSFQSPVEQEKRCRAMLEAQGLAAGQVFTDLDQSGGKSSRPEFDKMMARVRSGESGGVIVLKLNRMGRRGFVVDTVLEIENLGAVFISIEESWDTSTPMGRFGLRLTVSMDELELDQRTESWGTAVSNFRNRGGHGGPLTPAGYDREVREGRRTGRLVPNDDAPAVREAFRLRGRGRTHREVADYLTEQGVVFRTMEKGVGLVERTDWRASAARGMLSNRVYLGVVKAGGKEYSGEHAHDRIVTRGEFAKANGPKGLTRTNGGGERTEGSLLARFIHCGTCGGPMTNDGGRYRCNGRARGVSCEQRAVINRKAVDGLVEKLMLEYLNVPSFFEQEAGPSSVELAAAVTEAEEELAAFLAVARATDAGFDEAVAARRAEVEAARIAAAEGEGEGEGLTWFPPGAAATVYEQVALGGKRRFIEACVERVTVQPGHGRVEDRVAVELKPPKRVATEMKVPA